MNNAIKNHSPQISFFPIIKNTNLVVLLLGAFISFGCQKAKQRPEVIEEEIKGKLISVESFKDITTSSKAQYFIETEKFAELQKSDLTTQTVLTDDIKKALTTLKSDKSKKSIEESFKKGPIAFVVLEKEIKVFLVIKKTGSADERVSKKAMTYNELKELKGLSSDSNRSLVEEASSLVKKTDASDISNEEKISVSRKENSEFIEIASLKIKKSGVIENKKTKYYEEKTSVLTLAERPLELSTHVILEDETIENLKAQ